MPVIAERITQPSEQDLIDLSKTYEGDIDWLHALLASPDMLVGGRFNNRLLAAFILRDQQNHWSLERLQVREITRRRGVARQTIHSALQILNIKQPISVDLSTHPELCGLFESLGFDLQASSERVMQWQP
ncbi:MAG: GNAT superfamily N-acetyltransferase [Bermanella sp.]|jgi:GNAT superfamily N-acetyltransferase